MSLKVMAVDDDPEILKLIKSMVQSLGCEILTMVDSREAARRVEIEKFDGIFLDVQMPGLDGFELTTRVRASKLNRQIPVVMLTGLDDVETMRKGFKVGATCFMGKPISWERVYSLIKALRGPMLEEKRRNARLPYRTSVTCKSVGGAEEQSVLTSLIISEGGLLLQTSGGLEAGQEVYLTFQMPDASNPLNVRAKILRKEPPDRIAVEFIVLSENDREAIRKYIEGRVKL